jgi:lysophospholipase L1-like esterase
VVEGTVAGVSFRRTGRSRLLAAALALVPAALASLPACGDADTATGAVSDAVADPVAEGEPLLVIGDSLTHGARLYGGLGPALADAGWAPEIVAEDGRTIEWGLDQVLARDTVPATVIVGLGTNPGTEPQAFPERAATLVAELEARGARTVVWWPPGDADDAGRSLRAEALRSFAGGGLVVPDWPAELAAHPEWLDSDGVHYTDEGYAGLTAFLVDGLAALTPESRP